MAAMARPKEFDRDDALRAAVHVFWRQGYAATTTSDLVLAMGIGRQSFYDTFGDRRRLYVEALRRYAREEIAAQVDAARAAARAVDDASATTDVDAPTPRSASARGDSPLETLRAFLAADESRMVSGTTLAVTGGDSAHLQ